MPDHNLDIHLEDNEVRSQEKWATQFNGLELSGPLSVDQFVDILRKSTCDINYKYAKFLYADSCSRTFKDVDNEPKEDIRLSKYLLHIERHPHVVVASPYVQQGLDAGIVVFRIARHKESRASLEFKALVRSYVVYLKSIKTFEFNAKGPIAHTFDSKTSDQILKRLEDVVFPNDLTYPPSPPTLSYKSKPISRITDAPDAFSYKSRPLLSVGELHQRRLCVACRSYLVGICYRGDACSFCHDEKHLAEYERMKQTL